MSKIFLASRSIPRRKLLRQIGLKFKVVSPRIDENQRFKGRCGDFVIHNAVRKAEDVASRLDSGIVIGADTVVLAGRRIIGKPKNLDDAMEALKLLSRSPQWVYTGIAVKDIDKNKMYTAYEKTKVYMYRLSDRQIKNYFKWISPFDKAGSFDVQGPGSVFIDRIEGCFYNVVGLPLAKLAAILRKTGVRIL